MVADLLAPDGLFAFTVETHDGGGVVLGPKLRYAHGERHVRETLEAAGLTILRLVPVSTRMEADEPVPGLLVVAERKAAAFAIVGGLGSFVSLLKPIEPPALLPEVFARWFASRGWTPRAHQLDLLAHARDGRSALLIAPTGGGKTLAGFLPTLVDLSERSAKSRKLVSIGRDLRRSQGLHTLYISPLKALAVDIARNLEAPVAEMDLPIRIETRTGDTPVSKRTRQRRDPPDILLTTPEQLALLLASADAPYLFGTLKRVVLDELHALVTSKRGDLLSLGLARLFRLAPGLQTIGLSATVADPDDLRRYLVPQQADDARLADLVVAKGGAAPHVTMLEPDPRDPDHYIPWAGHSARHALPQIYDLIARHKTTLVFVNTRSQAELIFQELWRINELNLAIALHHGSLDVAQRRKVEDAMTRSKLRAVVCTSSLDLGIDWGDIDLVINVGAPKGSSRLLQRIGRANHRLDEPSRGILVPANRFEVLECRAAIDAVAELAQDTPPLRTGALDVLAQHVLGTACGEPFDADTLYDEVRSAAPYHDLTRKDFDDVIDFVATGGYALKAYERFAKIRQDKNGRWRVTHPRFAQAYRMNVGTIVESIDAEGAAGALAPSRRRAAPDRSGAAAASSARSRNISPRCSASATPSCLPARCCATRRWRKTRSTSRARNPTIRKSRPMPAASFRSRPISPRACATFSPIRRNGRRCRSRCANGWRFRNGARCCPGRASFWSRPFRAPTSIILSAIRSRGGWRIRRSACC